MTGSEAAGIGDGTQLTTAVPPSGREAADTGQHGAVARAVVLFAVGNGLSRVLGLARELVIAHLFGATGLVSVLRLAMTVPTLITDLVVVEVSQAALVPVFSALAQPSRRADLARVAGSVLALVTLALASAMLGLELLAPQLVWALGSGYEAGLQQAAVGLVRWALPAMVLLGASNILLALLAGLRRFTVPALVPAVYNLLVVGGTIALAPRLGVRSVIVGALAAAAGHLLLATVALRGAGLIRLGLQWRDPALRRVARLGAPVLAGLVVRQVQVVVERNLASHTGAQSLAWMENALTLFRLPLALAVAALSAALLPTLARIVVGEDPHAGRFRDTLAAGLKWAWLMTMPAAACLWVLAKPVTALMFEHGAFTAVDTAWTAALLRVYLWGLPFAAIDQLLVVAYYARQNTLTPVLIGLASMVAYLACAPALANASGARGLALAASLQIALHATLLLAWSRRYLDGLQARHLAVGALRIAFAALVAGAAAWLTLAGLEGVLPIASAMREAALVLVPLAAAAAGYVLALLALGAPEAADLLTRLRAWAALPRRRG